MQLTERGTGAAAEVAGLMAAVPEVAAEAVVRIRREFPVLHGLRSLDSLVEELITHFLQRLRHPATASEGVLARIRETGVQEARAGRGAEVMNAALRLGAGIAIARLTARAQRNGLCCDAARIGRVAQAVFAYTERLTEALSAGHRSATARGGDAATRRRRALAEVLLGDAPTAEEVEEAARQAGWRVPGRVVVIALRARACGGAAGPDGLALPPDALPALHLDPPCVIAPADGPAASPRRLLGGLRDWTAAVGPPVEVTGAARSRRWAGQALELAHEGLLPQDGPVVAADHLPLLMLAREPGLVAAVAEQRLAPLDSVRPSVRHELALTWLTLLECHFRARLAAERLHVHPQTIRYRLRRLEELFGEELYDPARQLETHLLLHARVTAPMPVSGPAPMPAPGPGRRRTRPPEETA